jgi:uncharacterized membrane protein
MADNNEIQNSDNVPAEIISPRELEELAREVGDKETAIKIVSFAEKYSGLIPHPRIMAQYKAILPDSPDRIIKMAEVQQEHRMGLEYEVIHGDVQRANLGLVLGFVLFFGLATGSVYLLSIGKDVQGYSVLATSLLGGIVNFIRVGRERSKPVPAYKPPTLNRKKRRKRR